MSEYQPKTGDQYQAPYDTPPEQKKSGCLKAFIILTIVGVVAMLSCCIGGAFYIRGGIVADPVKAREIANQIIDWDFNEEIEVKAAVNYFFARAAFLIDPSKGFVMIADSKYVEAKDVGRQMDTQLRSQANVGEGDIVEETELIEKGEEIIDVKGEAITFSFNHTRGAKTEKDYWEVMGIVPGKENPTFVLLKLLQSAYDKDAIIDRLKGIE